MWSMVSNEALGIYVLGLTSGGALSSGSAAIVSSVLPLAFSVLIV